MKACALALRRVPACNASFTADALLLHRRVDVSIAVALDDGLVTPVLRDADRKGLRVLAAEARALAARARAKQLRPEELTGGTFSISNLGMLGVDAFAAIVNPPEGAILAVGRARSEAVVKGARSRSGAASPARSAATTARSTAPSARRSFRVLRAFVEHPTRILL